MCHINEGHGFGKVVEQTKAPVVLKDGNLTSSKRLSKRIDKGGRQYAATRFSGRDHGLRGL